MLPGFGWLLFLVERLPTAMFARICIIIPVEL